MIKYSGISNLKENAFVPVHKSMIKSIPVGTLRHLELVDAHLNTVTIRKQRAMSAG